MLVRSAVACVALVAPSVSAADQPKTIDLADGSTLSTVIATDEEALRFGFRPAPLKDARVTEMIRDVHGFHADQILVYERRSGGAWTLAEDWCYPDWYGMGSSRLVKLFDDGRDQIRIDALGNTGTSTLQKFRMYVGWCGGAWRVLFCETTSYQLGPRTLTERFRWAGLGSARPRVSASIEYDERSSYGEEDLAYLARTRWTDRLAWNPATCSFYDPELEDRHVALADLPLRRRIGTLRLLASRAAPSELCEDAAPGGDTPLWSALTDVIEPTPVATPSPAR